LWSVPNLSGGGWPVAFNQRVYDSSSTQIQAYDPNTGAILWTANRPFANGTFGGIGNGVFKIDSSTLATCIGGGGWYTIVTFNTNDGSLKSTGALQWSKQNPGGGGWTGSMNFDPTVKMFYQNVAQGCEGWDLSNPSHPVWKWIWIADAYGGRPNACHDGLVFVSEYTPRQVCLNGTTGAVVWSTEVTGQGAYTGTYYQGEFIKGTVSNVVDCYNATTGQVLWAYRPNDYGFWASGSAAAYGLWYQVNLDGRLYALDAQTGKVVWTYGRIGDQYYSSYPIIADGKIYANTAQPGSHDFLTGAPWNTNNFACLDAYTGRLIWSTEDQFGGTSNTLNAAIAYGNIYGTLGNNFICIGSTPVDWTMWRGDSQRSAVRSAGPEFMSVKWRFTANAAIESSPTIVGGKVYFGSFDRYWHCIDANTGTQIWKFGPTGWRVRSSAAVVNGRVYTGADDGFVYCLDANTGTSIWNASCPGAGAALSVQQYGTPANFRSSPNVVGGKVYVGSSDGLLYCLDANSGQKIWTYNTKYPLGSSPTIIDSDLYISGSNGTLYKLDTNGNYKWQWDTPAARTDFVGTPTYGQGLIFLGSGAGDQYSYAINASTGSQVWRSNASTSGPTQVQTNCYTSDYGGMVFTTSGFNMVGVNATTGVVIWETYLTREHYSSSTYADGKIYVGSQSYSIYCLNAQNGSKLSNIETADHIWSSPTIYDGKIYCGSNDWNLYCVEESSYNPVTNRDGTLATPIIQATISATQINKGSSVTISGSLRPIIPYITQVGIAFVRPDQSVINVPASVTNGVFQASYTPDAAGQWVISAYSNADQYNHIALTNGNVISLTVVGPSTSPSPSPTPFPTPITTQPSTEPTPSPVVTPSATSTPGPGNPSTTTYLIIAVVVVIIVIAIAAVALRRKK